MVTLRWKCEYFMDKIDFLSMVLTPKGLQPCPKNDRWQLYKNFIKDFATLAQPLYRWKKQGISKKLQPIYSVPYLIFKCPNVHISILRDIKTGKKKTKKTKKTRNIQVDWLKTIMKQQVCRKTDQTKQWPPQKDVGNNWRRNQSNWPTLTDR